MALSSFGSGLIHFDHREGDWFPPSQCSMVQLCSKISRFVPSLYFPLQYYKNNVYHKDMIRNRIRSFMPMKKTLTAIISNTYSISLSSPRFPNLHGIQVREYSLVQKYPLIFVSIHLLLCSFKFVNPLHVLLPQ